MMMMVKRKGRKGKGTEEEENVTGKGGKRREGLRDEN